MPRVVYRIRPRNTTEQDERQQQQQQESSPSPQAGAVSLNHQACGGGRYGQTDAIHAQSLVPVPLQHTQTNLVVTPGAMDSRYYTEVIQLEPLNRELDAVLEEVGDIEDIPSPSDVDTCGVEESQEEEEDGEEGEEGGKDKNSNQPSVTLNAPASPSGSNSMGFVPDSEQFQSYSKYRTRRIANMREKYNKCLCFRCPELQRVNDKVRNSHATSCSPLPISPICMFM